MIGIITEKMSARKHFAEALGGDNVNLIERVIYLLIQ